MAIQLTPLTLQDRHGFERSLSQMFKGRTTALSTWAFAPHYIWKDQFSFSWTEIGRWRCLFAEYADGLYMPLPPLGPRTFSTSTHLHEFQDVVLQVMEYMKTKNIQPTITRIENVPSELATCFEDMGYTIRAKDSDYLYQREDIVKLEGERYKSQRHAYNRFLRNYSIEYQPYQASDQGECWELFRRWSLQKMEQYTSERSDHCEAGRFMLQDSESAHRIIMEFWEPLGLTGRVVRIDGMVCAYAFGFALTSEVYCILVEVTDRTIIGSSEYVFREYCRELESHALINTMDDSGLASLARSKQAYFPVELVRNYIVTQRV